MKLAVMGAGAVGGYIGARLAAAGNEVAIIARGAHGAAIRERGLEVRSELGDVTIRPGPVTDDPGTIGPVDVVIFAPKLYDTETAGALCRPLIGPDSVLISFQNGVESEAILGADHVAGGVAEFSANIAAPGIIQHNGPFARLRYGELDGRASARIGAFHAVVEAAGVEGRLSDAITTDLWRKFALLCPMASVCTLLRLSLGDVRDNPAAWRMLVDAVSEVVAVGRARGIDPGDDAVDYALDIYRNFPAVARPSLLFDLEHAKRLELDGLAGTVCRLADAHGVGVPVHRAA